MSKISKIISNVQSQFDKPKQRTQSAVTRHRRITSMPTYKARILPTEASQEATTSPKRMQTQKVPKIHLGNKQTSVIIESDPLIRISDRKVQTTREQTKLAAKPTIEQENNITSGASS